MSLNFLTPIPKILGRKGFFLFFTASILLSFSSCAQIEPPRKLTAQEQKERILDSYCMKTGRKLAKTHDLFLNGASATVHYGGRDPTKISFDFQIFRALTKNEARQLIYECVETIHQAFNNNPEIRPYIPEEGYPINKISLSFMIQPNKTIVFHPELGGTGLSRGKVEFNTNDPDKNYFPAKIRVFEPWHETLAHLGKPDCTLDN